MNNFDEVIASLQDQTEVAFAGDWHGTTNWARQVIQEVSERGVKVLLHVGDFGLWPDVSGEKYLRKVDRLCEQHDVYLIITPGNHENWTRLMKHWKKDEGPSTLGFKRLWFLPRNTRFELQGLNFLSFGGAASVDYTYRTKGKNWWPDEFPSDEDVAEAVAGDPADILILHETPDIPYATPQTIELLATNPLGFDQAGLEYSAESRKQVTEVLEAVKPRLVAHGHLHIGEAVQRHYPDGQDFIVLSLDREYVERNVAYLNLKAFKDSIASAKALGDAGLALK